MKKFRNFIDNHFDFSFYPVLIFSLIVFAIVYPCVKFLPETFGYENGVIENIQMVVLALCFIFAITAKTSKKFFYFAAVVIFLLIAREINYGRTVFFPVPGEVNSFYTWKEIKYGWLVNPLVGVYMACGVLYFIFSKAWLELWEIIKNVKIPVWNFMFLFFGIVIGEYAEKSGHSFILEEMGELLFYVSLMGVIWLFAFNKKFSVEKI